MTNKEIAEKIYDRLNEEGADLGTIAFIIIEGVLDEVLPQANVSGALPKTMKQLKALLFTAYLVGRDDEQKGGRSFTDWFKDVVERQ